MRAKARKEQLGNLVSSEVSKKEECFLICRNCHLP